MVHRQRVMLIVPVAILFLATCPSHATVPIAIQSKTLRDATHIELAGPVTWDYTVNRTTAGGHFHVQIQFNGIKAAALKRLETIKDYRIKNIAVGAGINNDALVDIELKSPKLNLFDYQTEEPVTLVWDVYSDEPKKPKNTARAKIGRIVKQDAVSGDGLIEPAKKKPARTVASTDQQSLSDIDIDSPLMSLKYGIFDGGDQAMTRFKIDPSYDSARSLVKAEDNLYLHFPPLRPAEDLINKVWADMPLDEVGDDESQEADEVKLLIKLYKEQKWALSLRTIGFIHDQYPNNHYQEALAFAKAALYFQLWKRDHDRTDLDRSLTLFKDFLNVYPKDPRDHSIRAFIGLAYQSVGNSLGALAAFESALADDPESPYYWSMKLRLAQAYMELNKTNEANTVLSSIENDPKSGGYRALAAYQMGDVFFHAKDYQKAIDSYAQALKKYPDNWPQAPNAFFNRAESEFWMKDYRASIDAFRDFLQRFPNDSFGGYAMVRIGEILEMMGAPAKKYTGAFLEANFRYHDSPGAYLARVRLQTERFQYMKPEEIEASVKSLKEAMPKNIDDIEPFLTLEESDGFLSRNEFKTSRDLLIEYYKHNPVSSYLPLFKRRIISNLAAEIKSDVDAKKSMAALQLFLENEHSWLQDSTRIDTYYYTAQSYDALDLPDDAMNFYKKSLDLLLKASPQEIFRQKVFGMVPEKTSVYLNMAKIELAEGRLKQSAEDLEQVKGTAPLTPEEQITRIMVIASLAEQEGRDDIAIAALKLLASDWKDQPQLLARPIIHLVRIYKKLNEPLSAIAWSHKLSDIDKSAKGQVPTALTLEALQTSGDLLYKQNRFVNAQHDYADALKRFADIGDASTLAAIRFKLGKTYYDQRRFDDAKTVWADLKPDGDQGVWARMANDLLTQAQWSKQYDRYLTRSPASEAGRH